MQLHAIKPQKEGDLWDCIFFYLFFLKCDPVIIAPFAGLIRARQLIYAAHQCDGCSCAGSLLNTAICPDLYNKNHPLNLSLI